ncbi:MAG: hypothetical protein U0165_11720 [Polyangiaceae bacterium]
MNRLDPLVVRASELFERVIVPVVLGGDVRPVKPIGPRLAARMSEAAAQIRTWPSERLTEVLEVRRARAAELVPIDAVPSLSRDEWRMASALNDLLQAANDSLSGLLFSGRHEVLLRSVRATLGRVPSPITIGEVVMRHATFAKAPSLIRIDTEISWWTGSAFVRGEPPPARLVAWPEIRRVSTRETKVPIHDIAQHVAVDRTDWLKTINEWLRRTPLTDLMFAGRDEPKFEWHPSVLTLVKSEAGAAISRRVLAHVGPRCDMALERATQTLENHEHLEIARKFLGYRREHVAFSP